MLLLVFLAFGCRKKEVKPEEPPTSNNPTTPAEYYNLSISARAAVYSQTAVPLGASDTRDSTYFQIMVGDRIVNAQAGTNLPSYYNTVVKLDSVKPGQDIVFSVRMRTFTKNAKETTLRLNKAWLNKTADSSEVILYSAASYTIPVQYSYSTDTTGQAVKSFTFIAP